VHYALAGEFIFLRQAGKRKGTSENQQARGY
jgi:hypothetical protein